MPAPRCALILTLGLVFSFLTPGAGTAAQAPRIGKPRPAPPTPPDVPPLPPAVIDNQLNVGGQDVKARKVETRAETGRGV